MQQMNVSVIGVAVTDVKRGVTEAGHPMARFRMVCRPRKFDAATGAVTEFDPSFVTVQCWRQLAEHVSASIAKGDPVLVMGRLRVREWEHEGRMRVSVEIDAQSVGHDLNRGTTGFQRSGATRPPEGERAAGSGPAEAQRSLPGSAVNSEAPAGAGRQREVA